MKKAIVFIVMSLFLLGFIYAAGITASAIENEEDSETGSNSDQNNINASAQNQKENLENTKEMENIQNQAQEKLNAAEIGEITREQNRIRTIAGGGECPENCTCAGSTTTCQLQNQRRITISAGKSGNTIMQVKEIDASTDVTLYKSDDKMYGVFKNNETREIKVFPDEVQEKIRERIQERLENQTMKLDEEGIYQIQAEKRARLFGFISVRARINAEIDSETGEVLRVRRPWWNFLAADEENE